MAPIKFEDDIKKKLEQRKLQPSEDAWEMLQNKLEANAAKNNNKTFWWLGIAASVVGALFVVSVFFDNDSKNTIESIIVDKKNDNKIEESQIVIQPGNTSVKVNSEDKTQKEILPEKTTNQSILKKQLQQQQDRLIKENVKEGVAQIETELNEVSQKEETVLTKALTFEDIKVQEVLAQINVLKETNQNVTEVEIDALLDQAQSDIDFHNLFNESTKKVDATALLQDVEADLDQSFRDRIFEALKTGYKDIKTAVAKRIN